MEVNLIMISSISFIYGFLSGIWSG
jgi:hypothetical protein